MSTSNTEEVVAKKTWLCPVCDKPFTSELFINFGPDHDKPGYCRSKCIYCKAKEDAAKRDEQIRKRKAERALAKQRKLANDKAAQKRRAENERLLGLERAEKEKIAKIKAKQSVAARAKRVRDKKKLQQTLATAEMAKRELARRHLIPFIKRFNDKYDAGWVHELICRRLEEFSEAVANQESPRLMIFMPPRTGKSEIASKNFPAWHLGNHPEHEIIAASYAVSLPMGFSRKIKYLLQDPTYHSLFPKCALDPNAQATEGWLTTKGGGYVPAGVGGGITGKGAHIFIIDDPVKDAEEADSETTRQNVWDWWDSTAETRLAPGGGVLVIQTRWHDDDLSGRMLDLQRRSLQELDEHKNELLEELRQAVDNPQKQEELHTQLIQVEAKYDEITKWDVLVFPALAESDEYITLDDEIVYSPDPERGTRLLRKKDEALHPARYDETFFRRKRRGSAPRYWSALYQQNPVPEEGAFYKKGMFRYEHRTPRDPNMHVYIAWDLAIGQKQTNDWTVGLVGVVDYDFRLHLVDCIRVRTDDLAELIFGTAIGHKSRLQQMGLETGQIQMSIMPALKKLMESRKTWFSFNEDLKPVTDKVARARPAQAWMQQGRILLPEGQPWTDEFVSELLRFPNGKFDDQVDALSWLVRMVMSQSPPQKARLGNKNKSWKDKIPGTTAGARNHLAA